MKQITFFKQLSAGVIMLSLANTAFSADSAATTTESVKPYSERADVAQFIQEMVKKHNFDVTYLRNLFTKVERQQSILDAISKPAERRLTWDAYRRIFIKPNRISAGVEFWNEHAALLNQAERKYGVPPEMIVAIIGVETLFGRYKGKHRVVDALSTLGFDYPRRAKFFSKELKEFLLMTREENIDPFSLKGSYAGAMGMPQFIPSSYRAYAVDFDGDGKRNLWNNPADVIGSVANYFARHGWKTGGGIAHPARIRGKADLKPFLQTHGKPLAKLSVLNKKRITTAAGTLNINTDVALTEFDKDDDSKEYWLTEHNFYVITRYNHSRMYALAAFQLSQAIKEQRQQQKK